MSVKTISIHPPTITLDPVVTVIFGKVFFEIISAKCVTTKFSVTTYSFVVTVFCKSNTHPPHQSKRYSTLVAT